MAETGQSAGRRIVRILERYGTILVLLILVLFFSRATIATQFPEGQEAVQQIVDAIEEQYGSSAHVFVAATP